MSRTNDRVYLRNRERLKRQPNLVCVACGQPIDVTLPQYDPMAFTADHVVPVGLGGDNRGELQPMHRIHNQQRGVKDLDDVRPSRHTRQHY
jgi:5-methylcytosine-specific restriction endonuclease McrA